MSVNKSYKYLLLSSIFCTFVVLLKGINMEKESINNHDDLLIVSRAIAKHDKRIDRCKKHDATTIVFITLCAVLGGYKTWNEIADYGLYKKALLEQYLGPLDSVPSHDTISRFFSILKPEAFEGEYRKWVGMVFRRHKSDGDRPDVIAVDGKEIRSASEPGVPVRILSAYSTDWGISLGQEIIGGKTNEIPAMQELVSKLDVKGCLVTADALNCQKKTCQAIIDAKADYLLFAKSNQRKLMEAIEERVNYTMIHPRSNTCKAESMDRTHSREIHRKCIVIGEPLYLGSQYKEWTGIKSFGAVINESSEGNETRYFISSMKMDAEFFLEAARKHWGVENGLHWRLDVDFDEDGTRKKRNAAKNFSIISKMAIAILSMDKSKMPFSRKRMRMAMDDGYFKSMLNKLYENL